MSNCDFNGRFGVQIGGVVANSLFFLLDCLPKKMKSASLELVAVSLGVVCGARSKACLGSVAGDLDAKFWFWVTT